MNETRRQLDLVWRELEQNDHARRVYAQYMHVIGAMEGAAAQLWSCGEDKFAAAMESRITDVELIARRHLMGIRERVKKGDGNA